jgi:riboflavin biosynthesis pyrimidine reductase
MAGELMVNSPWNAHSGAGLAQSLLREGLLDELEIHLIPVLLGGGGDCSAQNAPNWI